MQDLERVSLLLRIERSHLKEGKGPERYKVDAPVASVFLS